MLPRNAPQVLKKGSPRSPKAPSTAKDPQRTPPQGHHGRINHAPTRPPVAPRACSYPSKEFLACPPGCPGLSPRDRLPLPGSSLWLSPKAPGVSPRAPRDVPRPPWGCPPPGCPSWVLVPPLPGVTPGSLGDPPLPGVSPSLGCPLPQGGWV